MAPTLTRTQDPNPNLTEPHPNPCFAPDPNQVAALFAPCGPATVDMTLDPKNGRCRGACFVTF